MRQDSSFPALAFRARAERLYGKEVMPRIIQILIERDSYKKANRLETADSPALMVSRSTAVFRLIALYLVGDFS